MQSSDKLYLFVVLNVQSFDRFKSVSYSYPISGLKHPPASWIELIFTGYYVCDMQAMHLDTQVPTTASLVRIFREV